MKTYKEMSDNVIRRSKIIINNRNKKRKQIAKGILAVICVLCIVILVNEQREQSIITEGDNDSGTSSSSMEDSSKEEQMVLSPEESLVAWMDKLEFQNEIDESDGAGLLVWHGKIVKSSLAEVLNKDDNNLYFAIEIFCNNINNQYVYNGRTIQDYKEAANKENELGQKLGELIKEGEYLKYGEELYQIGTQSGEKWSKELYDSRVEYYGSEIMSLYFFEGDFLTEKVQEDLKYYLEGNANKSYFRAINMYRYDFFVKLHELLYEKGIYSEYSSKNENLLMFVTKEEFVKFKCDKIDDCIFGWAWKESNAEGDDTYEKNNYINSDSSVY